MADSKYGSGGILFPNDRRTNDRQPIMHGDMTIEKEDLRKMFKEASEGKEVKLRLACFVRTGRRGKFYSIAVQLMSEWEAERDAKKAQEGQQTPQSQQQGDPWDTPNQARQGPQGDLDDEIPF